MHLSVREVLDLAERCFTVAGFDEGPARANAETVWWQEAYRGTGMSTLHGLLDDLDSFDRTGLSLAHRSGDVAVVDGGSQPGLVSLNPAVDLASSFASHNGIGIVRAKTGDDDPTLSSLGHQAFRAGRRGLVSLTLYADRTSAGSVVGVPDDPYPRIAETELPAPSESYADLTDFLSRGHDDAGTGPLVRALCKAPAEDHLPAEQDLLERLLAGAIEPHEPQDRSDGGDPVGFVTVCVDPTHPRYTGGCRGVVEAVLADPPREFTRRFDPDDVRDRIETLLENGIDVERSVWRDVFDYSSGVLAPEFEGSYQGAGFDINE